MFASPYNPSVERPCNTTPHTCYVYNRYCLLNWAWAACVLWSKGGMSQCCFFWDNIRHASSWLFGFYFGGARSKGFATLSNVSKVFPNVSKLLRNQFQMSSSPLIYSYSYLFFWLEILTKVFDRKHWLQKQSGLVASKYERKSRYKSNIFSASHFADDFAYVLFCSANSLAFTVETLSFFPLKCSLEFVLSCYLWETRLRRRNLKRVTQTSSTPRSVLIFHWQCIG